MTERHEATEEAEIILRDIDDADIDWLLQLNNASVPHVNKLDRESLTAILERSDYARCVTHKGMAAGAMITLWPGSDYASTNYRWFSQHHSDFLYIDRVMIDGSIRKLGLGRRLYADIEQFAKAQDAKYLACEVNSEPPNPISMRFHEALGFRPVGELANEDHSKSVVLMMKACARSG